MSTSQGNSLYTGYNGTKQNPKSPNAPSSGTDYSAVQNPYSTSYANRTGWDAFVESLGFTSAYQKYEMERKRNEELWNSSQQELQRQEMYNSASEQVAREREAGLNPDLNGGVSAGDASEQTPLPIGSESEAIQNMNKGFSDVASIVLNGVNSIANITSSCVSGALAISTKLESLRGTKVENLNKVASGVFDMVDKLDSFGFNPTEAELDEDGNTILPPAVKQEFDLYIDSLPRKQRKFARQLYPRYIQSLVHWNKRGEQLKKLPDSIVAGQGAKSYLGDVKYDPISRTFKDLDPLVSGAIKYQSEMYNLLYNLNYKDFINKDGELDLKKLEIYNEHANQKILSLKKGFDHLATDTINELKSSSSPFKKALGYGIQAAYVLGDKFQNTMDREASRAGQVLKVVAK